MSRRTKKRAPAQAGALPTDDLLAQRQATHGDFERNAAISQALKQIFRSEKFPTDPVHREALDLIATKLSRVLSGQADFEDHWLDVAGYAELARKVRKP